MHGKAKLIIDHFKLIMYGTLSGRLKAKAFNLRKPTQNEENKMKEKEECRKGKNLEEKEEIL